jgi:hypothetical protein
MFHESWRHFVRVVKRFCKLRALIYALSHMYPNGFSRWYKFTNVSTCLVNDALLGLLHKRRAVPLRRLLASPREVITLLNKRAAACSK